LVLFFGLGLFGASAVLRALSTHLEFALDKAEWRQVAVRAQPLVEAISATKWIMVGPQRR
jgi:hypothetical protein